jgi:hypothetical protein
MKKPLGVLLLGVCMLTASCSDDGGPSAASQYSPPGVKYGEIMAACLEEYGWDAEASVDGGLDYNVPEDQREAIEADVERCREETGYNLPDRPFSEEEAVEIYAMYLESAECVEALGYEVAEPPSEEAWVEHFLAGTPPGWDPYDPNLWGTQLEENIDFYAECPHPLDTWQLENL